MSSLMRALTVLTLLAAAVVLVALGTQNLGRVALTYGTSQIEVSLSVAAALLALLLGVTFYFGQLATWLSRLPTTLQRLVTGRHRQTSLQAMAEAYAAAFLGQTREATRAAARISADADEAALVQLLNIRLGTIPSATLTRWQTDPLLGAPASLDLAQRAALNADWAAVRAATTEGLKLAPNSPRLLFLHFKAVLNLGQNAEARDLFPSLRPHLSSSTAKKVEVILQGTLNPDVSTAGLKSPWYTAFQQWLGNAAEQLPDG